ncbi:MAG: hypothetical protein ACREBH_00145 [Candidatus Micrarchaeaceae archaeon]
MKNKLLLSPNGTRKNLLRRWDMKKDHGTVDVADLNPTAVKSIAKIDPKLFARDTFIRGEKKPAQA